LIADYCELLTLHNVVVRPDRLADFLEDMDWELRPALLRPGQARQDAQTLSAAEFADAVFEMIKDRGRVLGERYPFQIQGRTLQIVPGTALNECQYLAILAVATVHAYSLQCDHDPKQVFESTVARTLANRSLSTSDFGAVRRNSASFEVALETACESIGFRANPEAVHRSYRAQDAGVDTLAHLTWADDRRGAFAWIGQVTCAKSDEWSRKLAEPKAPTWSRLLGIGSKPSVFLAVPHHVESDHLAKLVDESTDMVLDRLRLAAFMPALSDSERALVDAIGAARIESF
jgi:hypothetical protein